MVNQGRNEKLQKKKRSSRSIPIKNSNRVNREDSIQYNSSKLESELEQLNNTNNDIPAQSELNPDQGNPYIDNQYDKRKLLIFHQNIR
jgi:hypothetical protein